MSDPFFILHRDLPREGPGDAESLAAILAGAEPPRGGRVLDAGCGPGADVPALLDLVPGGRVVAVDAHAPFVERVAARFADDPRVEAVAGDMLAVEGPFDLVWCAGAIYFAGVTEALRAWAPRLAPGGRVVFSDPVWLTEDRPGEAVMHWAEYPAMTDVAGVEAKIRAAGFEPEARHLLSAAAWEAYFGPMEARIDALRPGADAALAAVLDEHAEEIRIGRAHLGAFGYMLFRAAP